MKIQKVKLNKNKRISVMEDILFVIEFDERSRDEKHELELIFEIEGVSAEVVSMQKLEKGEVLNLTTISHHKVPHTSCEVNIREVLTENAQANYIGKIIIEKSAKQTSSFLNHNVLVIGDKTKNSSQPILQIEANDVKASHGSTTGRIDESQIYYLTSRGIGRSKAENLIVDGFFEELADKMKKVESKT